MARIEVDETHRAQLPLQTFPISSGIKGGIAGGIAMVIPGRDLWPAPLSQHLVRGESAGRRGCGHWANPTLEQMTHFHLSAFITANIIQGATTLLVGLLYGAMLPMWPKRPILLGGIIAPVMWTGLLHSILGIVNPFLADRISTGGPSPRRRCSSASLQAMWSPYWPTQAARQVPLSVRLGVETPGLHPGEHEKEPKP